MLFGCFLIGCKVRNESNKTSHYITVIDKTTHWMLDAGCWMLDAGCWILDAGYWILDAGCWILDAGCWMLDADAAKLFGEGLNFGLYFADIKVFCKISLLAISSIQYPASSIGLTPNTEYRIPNTEYRRRGLPYINNWSPSPA
jgi:hypothetical protein